MSHNAPRLSPNLARELAVRASTDPRTVNAVLRDPASADRNSARARAAEALRAAGYLPPSRTAA